MKCVSCSTDIDPKWKVAIEKNFCPFCGQEIMEARLKDLFTTLRSNMDSLQEFPEQLEEWLFSNFSFIKTSSPKLIDFVDPELLRKNSPSKKAEPPVGEKTMIKVGDQEVETQKVMSDEKVNDFFKRAEVVKKNDPRPISEREKRLKILKSQIESGEPIGEMDPDAEGVDPEAAREFKEAMEAEENSPMSSFGGGGVSFSGGSGGKDFDFGNIDEDIPLAVQMMAKGRVQNAQDQKDLARLQQMMEKQKASRESVAGGGRGGSFSRSG